MLKLNDNIKSIKNVFIGSANNSVISPKEYRVYFIAEVIYTNDYIAREEIGFYDFKNKYGMFKNIFSADKEYKNYKSMLNYIYNNIDNSAMLDTKIESNAMNTAKEFIKAENKEIELKVPEIAQLENANSAITDGTMQQIKDTTYYIIDNKAFINRNDAKLHCIINKLDPETIEEYKQDNSKLNKSTDIIINHLFDNTKLNKNKESIKQYITKCKENNDKKERYTYELQEGYKIAESFINALEYNYYNSPEYEGVYQGCKRLTCKDCLHCKNDCINKTYTCNKINEKYLSLFKDIKINPSNDICNSFNPYTKVTYDTNKYNNLEEYLTVQGILNSKTTFDDWKRTKYEYVAFNDYINWLANEQYIDYKGDTTIQDKTCTIYINDYKIEIPINDKWFNLDFVKDDTIHYKNIDLILYNSKARKNKRTSILDKIINKYNSSIPIDQLMKESIIV